VDPDDGQEEEGPLRPLLPPDDRLWRHPSEVASSGSRTSPKIVVRATSRVWPVALVAGLIGALVATGIGMVVGEFTPTTLVKPVTNQVVPDAISTAGNNAPDWPAILDILSPSVVTVIAEGPSGEVITSGVICEAEGSTVFAFTDASSLAGASSARVELPSGGPSLAARIMGVDQQTGVAVVAVSGVHSPTAFIGSVSQLQAGEPVDVLASDGAAVGSGASPVDPGVVSSTNRELQASGAPTLLGMLALTTGSPAEGGAAVVDPSGAVVGITTALTPANGSGSGTIFAVPIDTARRVANELIEGTDVPHPWLGFEDATDLPTAAAAQLGVNGGAIVEEVSSAGPAAAAGIEDGDIVTSINGQAVTSAAALLLINEEFRVGKRVTVTYFHSGHRRKAEIVVAGQPQQVLP
jgi:putative serine protease PepD